MTYKISVDHDAIAEHVGLYNGGTAVIVLGGMSAANWTEIYTAVRPDVLIIANGVNAIIRCADYWVCTENMTRVHARALAGNNDAQEYMAMYQRESFAEYKIVSHRSAGLIAPHNRIVVNRHGYDGEHYNPRQYGMGLVAGWVMRHPSALIPVRAGTVAAQCLHWAALLGVSAIHTIGLDLCFGEAHHAYPYPRYGVDRYRRADYATTYCGLNTQWAWVESAQWLIERMIPDLRAHGITWRDYSGGLLAALRAPCAI